MGGTPVFIFIVGMRLNEAMHARSDWLTCTWLLCHLECGEGLDIAVCIKHRRFVQASTVFVNLNLVSKVKGGLRKCRPYCLSLILTTDLKFGVTSHRTQMAIALAQWPLSVIFCTLVHVLVMATIWEWHLFRSVLSIVQLLLKGTIWGWSGKIKRFE